MQRSSAQIEGQVQGSHQILELIGLAAEGLAPMWDREAGLFCYRLTRTEGRLIREGISHRYTLIALLGLHQLEEANHHSSVPIRDTVNRLLAHKTWIHNLGDLGLLLWVCALVAPDRVEETCANLDLEHALARYEDASRRRTMELGWFLSGIAHTALASGRCYLNLRDLALITYHLLRKNQGSSGFFGHLAKLRSFRGLLRGSIGSFADQVYPIYALTRFAEAYGVEDAREAALNCAVAICKTQGPLGQWWWHYDSVTGSVVQKYPVYSVHQDGMAPMALFALGNAIQLDFTAPIFKGLQWISGSNELGFDMRDPSENLIWRSIYPRNQYKKHYEEISGLIRFGEDRVVHNDLAVRFECRPYHLGWLLYAFAPRCSPCTEHPGA